MIKIGKTLPDISVYTCQPKSKSELKELIKERISEEGPNCDLNDIDTSLIIDMSELFFWSEFNGDISKWNVGNVINMTRMFYFSKFNGDISNWNIGNVFNMMQMFYKSKFNQDISRWNINKVYDKRYMLLHCPIKEEYKPKSIPKL